MIAAIYAGKVNRREAHGGVMFRWLRFWKRRRVDEPKLAASAFDVLNELMGELHAGCVGVRAIQQPDFFMTKHPTYIIRIAIGSVVIALRKFDDLWRDQLSPILLRDRSTQAGETIHYEISQRKLRSFCNQVIAHYAAQPLSPKTSLDKIEKLLKAQRFPSDLDFFKWTQTLLPKLEAVRTEVTNKYGIKKGASTP
jgi:hypothetical protein